MSVREWSLSVDDHPGWPTAFWRSTPAWRIACGRATSTNWPPARRSWSPGWPARTRSNCVAGPHDAGSWRAGCSIWPMNCVARKGANCVTVCLSCAAGCPVRWRQSRRRSRSRWFRSRLPFRFDPDWLEPGWELGWNKSFTPSPNTNLSFICKTLRKKTLKICTDRKKGNVLVKYKICILFANCVT